MFQAEETESAEPGSEPRGRWRNCGKLRIEGRGVRMKSVEGKQGLGASAC